MRNGTGRRRPVRVFGGFLVAALVASGAVLAVGGGVASAATTNFSAIGAPTQLRQNTMGNETVAGGVILPSGVTGATAALQFDVPSWTAGESLFLTVMPDDSGHAGSQCTTNGQPQGVNQSTPQEANYVGFAQFRNNTSDGAGTAVVPPLVDGAGVPGAPHVVFTQNQNFLIPCSLPTAANNPLGVAPSLADGSYHTLVMTFTNSGQNGRIILGQGVSQTPMPDQTGPIILDVGFGASTGPVHLLVNGAEVPVTLATVVGQTPTANVPPSALTRNTATDAVSGPISEFKIIENISNALPPTDGTPPNNAMGPNQFTTGNNAWTHTLRASAPGAVCLVLDNGSGNNLNLNLGANGWSVSANAGTSGFSAAAGAAAVTDGATALYLPVTSSSNAAATWTTTGLSMAGTAYADGPVYAYAYWLQGAVDGNNIVTPPPTTNCSKAYMDANPAYKLGYVQLTTIRELANSVFGANAEATAAQAVDHQFDSAKGDCVSNTVGYDFKYGSSIFLARSDHYADGLGAAYAAGTVNSGVLLTPPNSLDPLTATQIRLQGVATVFVAGGPLAISDAVVDQLENTVAYQCGGTDPRVDPNTGEPKTLNVIRIFGQTLYDTNERLAEFVGAEPPAAFGQFGATTQFNTTTGMSTAGPAPAGPVNTALLVTGENFQDAMVASVPAYGGDFLTSIGKTGPMPLIATATGSLSPQAQNAIFNQHIGQVLVIGGPLAVSDNVMTQLANLGVRSIRIAGADNTETSTLLAAFELSSSLGFGYLNFDPDWDAYVNRTAGNINFNQNEQVSARVVLMTRGDTFPDAMAAAGVLSVHNGRFRNDQKFPLIATVNPSTLGPAVTAFLQNASLPVSGLIGQSPARGRADQPGTSNPAGDDCNNLSSSVFTIQPIGGPFALTPALLSQAIGLIGSTPALILPGTSTGCPIVPG